MLKLTELLGMIFTFDTDGVMVAVGGVVKASVPKPGLHVGCGVGPHRALHWISKQKLF